jgi:hypothetical protein
MKNGGELLKVGCAIIGDVFCDDIGSRQISAVFN